MILAQLGADNMRVTSGFWVGSYLRRAMAEGCFTSVVKRGAEEAGAIFIILNHGNGEFSLFGQAPQSVFDDTMDSERLFTVLIENLDEAVVLERLEREKNFDPDLWVIENEDRSGRSFLELVKD
jgi:hypothetical protein